MVSKLEISISAGFPGSNAVFAATYPASEQGAVSMMFSSAEGCPCCGRPLCLAKAPRPNPVPLCSLGVSDKVVVKVFAPLWPSDAGVETAVYSLLAAQRISLAPPLLAVGVWEDVVDWPYMCVSSSL